MNRMDVRTGSTTPPPADLGNRGQAAGKSHPKDDARRPPSEAVSVPAPRPARGRGADWGARLRDHLISVAASTGAAVNPFLLPPSISGRPAARSSSVPDRVPFPRDSPESAVAVRFRAVWQEYGGRVVVQALVILAAVLAYFGVRGVTESGPGIAERNADLVMSLQRFLNIDVEAQLQQLVVGHPDVVRVLNWIYIFGHWPVIALTLAWLVFRHRDVFFRMRNAMLISGGVGLIIFAMFPVAPPRLVETGLVDTVTEQSSAYRYLQPPVFTNQYAAMPSLHVGWNLLVTAAILLATRRIWLRVSAVVLSTAMDASVVLTANHYVLDAIVGAALATAAWHLAGQLQAGQPLARRLGIGRNVLMREPATVTMQRDSHPRP
jgi:membrane-associated phospholipid phosphatase